MEKGNGLDYTNTEGEDLKRAAWVNARREVSNILKGNTNIDLYFINPYNDENVEYLGNDNYIINDIVEITEQEKDKILKNYVVHLKIIGDRPSMCKCNIINIIMIDMIEGQNIMSKEKYYELLKIEGLEITPFFSKEEIDKITLSMSKEVDEIVRNDQYNSSTMSTISPIDKGVVEHMKHLQKNGLYEIGISPYCILGKSKTSPEDFKIYHTNYKYKKIYHGAPLEQAKKIITDGYLRCCKDKETPKYNKVFFSKDEFYWSDVLDLDVKGSLYNVFREYIIFEIDAKGHDIYSYIDDKEWIVLGDVDISKANIYLVKDDKSINKISKDELLNLSMPFSDLLEVSTYVRKEVFKKLEYSVATEVLAICYYSINNIKCLGDNKYIVNDIIEIEEYGKPSIVKGYVVELQVVEGEYNIIKMSIMDKVTQSIHGKEHAERVYKLVCHLADIEGISEEDKEVLTYSALYHDIGRTHDGVCEDHGKLSFIKVLKDGLIDKSYKYLETVKFIIENHCISDNKGIKNIINYDIKDKEKAIYLYKVFKDADNLDRVRIHDLDSSFLRFHNSHKLIDIAYNLYNKRYMNDEEKELMES